MLSEKRLVTTIRLPDARQRAATEGRDVRDGEAQTACAQTCPAKAITFGNFLDESSGVRRLSDEARGYALLGDLGTRPSVTYLKKVLRDPASIAAFIALRTTV